MADQDPINPIPEGTDAGETPQAGKKAVVVNPELVKTMAAHPLGRGHIDGDKPGSTACPRGEISDRLIRDETIAIGEPRRHGGHDDAIRNRYRTDLLRREKLACGHEIGVTAEVRRTGRMFV